MRHLVKGKKLGRNTSHRKATMKALSCSLIEHKSIQTTVAKAKELRRYVEPVITRAKKDTSHNRRQVFSSLQNKTAVSTLFDEIIPEVGDRPGGYTRILKLGFRLGDSAEMALIELVDFSDYQPEKKSAKKKRTRRAGKTNKPTTAEEEAAAAENKENKKEETSASTDSKAEETEVKEKKEAASVSQETDVEKTEVSQADEKEEIKDQTDETGEKDPEEEEGKSKK